MSQPNAFGTQIWLERHDTTERIEYLFKTAAECGIGHVRLFLMWNWIEATPGVWEFGTFDRAFDSAARHGILIKATLTANSGPWHVGTPMALHTHTGFLTEDQRGPMREYIRQCATRYAKHPAMGQWILWNEPLEPGTRGEVALAFWRSWLEQKYAGKLDVLNERWLTGFKSFTEIPFPEEIAHPKHRKLHWLSYRPAIDDWQCRAAWLVDELKWVKETLREFDPVTPTCVNPPGNLANLASSGTDLASMAAGVEVLGASFHPAWGFVFADRHDYPALIATGVRQMVGVPGTTRIEITEVQTGNTTESSVRPNDVTAGEIARYYLAGLAAGAESVTGWCFNVRQPDNEAGDWALLDDGDEHSSRSRMLRVTADRYNAALKKTGAWKPARPDAVVLSSPDSQAIEMIVGRDAYTSNYGRRANDGPEGAALLAVSLLRLGVSTTIARPTDAPRLLHENSLIVASHVTSWERADVKRLLDAVERGATLLFDGVSGRRDHDAKLHQPWPGELADKLGFAAAGLETRFEGWPWTVGGFDAGVSVLTRIVLKHVSSDWKIWPEARFIDGEACVLERSFGHGRVVLFRGLLGASRVAKPLAPAGIEWLLQKLRPGGDAPAHVVAGSPFAVTIPVATEHGALVVLLAPERTQRGGQPVRIRASRQSGWTDLWTDQLITPGVDGEFTLAAEDGVALLWNANLPAVAGSSVARGSGAV